MTIQSKPSIARLTSAEATIDESDEGAFGIVDLLRFVRVRHRIILGTAFTVIALVTAVILQVTPLYSSNAVVMLDQRKNNVEDTDAVLSGLPADQTAVQNQVQILTSLELAGRVVDKLRLSDDPEFNPKAGAGGWGAILKKLNPLRWLMADRKTQADALQENRERMKISHRLLSAVVVEPIGTSTAIKVSFTSPNPQKAARIANAIADAYVEDQLVAKFEATQKATEWLASRISDLSQKAQAADAAVQLYKAQHNITTTANGASVLQQQLADLNNQVIVAKTDLAEKQTSYSHLAALARSGRAANSGQVLASPLIATLRAQEATLQNQAADLQAKYGPRHPKMRDLDAQKANLDSKINEEIQRVVESKQTEVEAAQSRLYSLQSSLQNLEQENAGQNRDSVPLIALQSAAASARAMYEAFLGRLNQTQGQQGIQTPDARIISRAEVSQAPSYPKKGLSIGLSIPAGLLLGLLFAYLAERLDSGFRTASQVETALGLPVLSTVPEVISPDSAVILRAVDLIVDKPTSAFAEAIRGLQLGLALSNVDVPPKVIIVTSAVPSEGKTTLAISLARMAVRSGLKCVVVDGDLRRPNVAKVLEIEKPGRGLVDVLVDHTPVEDCFSKDPRSDVQLLTCGVSPPSPAEVLSSQAMHHLVEKLRQSFDLVIIDSAPILPVNDTKVLSRLADAVLVVVRWEKTPREAATNAVRSLMDVHAPIAGIALARADNERFRYYSYGYQSYYSYDKYYGK